MEKITKNPNILWAAIALLLAIQFIPQVGDFWQDHFVDPIMADSKGEAGAKYNVYNTIVYGFCFFLLLPLSLLQVSHPFQFPPGCRIELACLSQISCL